MSNRQSRGVRSRQERKSLCEFKARTPSLFIVRADDDEAFPAAARLFIQALQRAAERDLRRALAAVEAPRRAVILLIDVDGFKIAEIADILGVPPETAASRLARAREKPRVLLAPISHQTYSKKPPNLA